MLISETIILAGGLGTRLRTAVPDLPKCMAPIAGKPFLFYLLSYLRNQNIQKFILSLGYKHEVIEEYLKKEFNDLDYKVVIEKQPLGTGGAISLAVKQAVSENVLVVNGDTYFAVDLQAFSVFHQFCGSHCTLALKPMRNFDRYGVVELNSDYSILSFREKDKYVEGLINGGVYALNVPAFRLEKLPEVFSFEKEYLEKLHSERRIFGFVQDKYFIDIGIPEDFQRSQIELQEHL